MPVPGNFYQHVYAEKGVYYLALPLLLVYLWWKYGAIEVLSGRPRDLWHLFFA